MIVTAAAAALLAADLVMFFTAKQHFGTNRNIFSVFAALICLPIAKWTVSAVMFWRARGCSESAAGLIKEHIGSLCGLYDLYMTSYQENFQVSHITAAARSVCGLCEAEGTDVRAAEKHIRTMLENNGFRGYSVKLFTDPAKYAERLDSLNRLSSGEKPAEAVAELLKSLSI